MIGVILDGTGYGTDGAVWGGEFLIGDYRTFRRGAHLRYVAMPGGEQAIREPWRMAVSHLADSDQVADNLFTEVAPSALAAAHLQIERRLNAPMTSSMGRLFDAVAALAGVRHVVSHEGQAAMRLEALAWETVPDGSYPFELIPGPSLVIDTRPLIRKVLDDRRAGCPVGVIARRFHTTLVEMIAQVCSKMSGESGLSSVVLSGGVFMNALLTSEATARLTRDGFRVYRHERVPTNDGGVCLGQLAIAAA